MLTAQKDIANPYFSDSYMMQSYLKWSYLDWLNDHYFFDRGDATAVLGIAFFGKKKMETEF